MTEEKTKLPKGQAPGLSEEDVIEGMKALHGYIDLTPHDFRLLYEKAYEHARRRVLHEHAAADFMTSPAVSIGEEDDLEALIRLLAEHGHSGLPVLDREGRLCGVVSTKDVLTALGFPPFAHAMWLAANSLDKPMDLRGKTQGKKVREVMSAPPLYALPETSMAEVARIFREKGVNRLPVAEKSGRLCGIITRSDLINALSRLL